MDSRELATKNRGSNDSLYDLVPVQKTLNFRDLTEMARKQVPEIGDFVDDEDLILDPEELIIETKESIDSLYDLVPYLEELLELDSKVEASRLTEDTNVRVYAGKKAYERIILEKFPAIEEAVAESLIRTSWVRHEWIRETALAHRSVQKDPEVRVDVRCPENPVPESSGRHIITTAPPTKLHSIADKENLHLETSISNPDTTGESGQPQIPPPPIPLEHGVEFRCNICFRMQYGIYNKLQWKYVPLLV